MANLKLSGKMREIPMGNPNIWDESDSMPVESDDKKLLKESIALLRIALGMHTFGAKEQSGARQDIRSFIEKCEARN